MATQPNMLLDVALPAAFIGLVAAVAAWFSRKLICAGPVWILPAVAGFFGAAIAGYFSWRMFRVGSPIIQGLTAKLQ